MWLKIITESKKSEIMTITENLEAIFRDVFDDKDLLINTGGDYHPLGVLRLENPNFI